MNPTLAILVVVLVIGVVVAFVLMRGRSAAALEIDEPGPQPLPPPDASLPSAASVVREAAPVGGVAATPEPSRAPAIAPDSAPVADASPAAALVVAPPVAPAPVVPARDTSALRKGLQQTRGGWVQKLVGLFTGKREIDGALMGEIEETLLTGDVGSKTTERLTGMLRERLEGKDLSNADGVWSALESVVHDVIDVPAPAFGARAVAGSPFVILVVGVNGVGKTTTIGKLAARYRDQGKKVYLAAADTFRAAAVAQLEAWGKRVGVHVVKGKDLSKPSAVVFDAVKAGVDDGADVVIADTAGRLHTKTPLMDELRKLRDAAAKAMPGAPHEILIVLDATTGQNGVIQVREFRDALELTGIVLTKLDGTAKGGVILAVCDEFKLPVRFVGVGERLDDLREFDAGDFAAAMFADPSDATAAS